MPKKRDEVVASGARITIEMGEGTGSSWERDAVTVDEVTRVFEQALRACGFFPKGHVEWVEVEE